MLGLLAALAYGTSDFAAGLASRLFAAGAVTGAEQAIGLLIAAAAVVLAPHGGPGAGELGWGALSGLGAAVGLLALFHGLSIAPFSVVATLSAVLVAVIPALVGLLMGNHLSTGAAAGIAIAIPAIGLVSWQPESDDRHAARAGVLYGILAGLGLALLLIALDRAGTRAGAWPLIPSQAVSLLLVAPFARRDLIRSGRPSGNVVALMLAAGTLAGIGNLLFLSATSHGQLAIVAVLTAMYPAVPVILARVVLTERWTHRQAAGLLAATAAVVLVSVS